jgi:hypothetical protein
MVPIRRRMAIGIFATSKGVEIAISRLEALGIRRHECFALPADQAPSDLAPRQLEQVRIDLGTAQLPQSGHIVLRVYVDTVREEQLVAETLLDSPAESVQLHDVNPPPGRLH